MVHCFILLQTYPGRVDKRMTGRTKRNDPTPVLLINLNAAFKHLTIIPLSYYIRILLYYCTVIIFHNTILNFTTVKKYISISILVIYMISSTELSQLLRIPLLIEHFIEHNQDGNQLSIGDFFHMHYIEKQHMDADYDKDMQLPFKTADGNTMQAMAFLPFCYSFLKAKPLYIESVKFAYHSLFIEDAYLSSIWQPPRSA